MKLVRGERLDAPAVLGRGLAERLRLFARIGDAVSFAHANGVIHRDLKPANIMVGAFGEVLVMDWGIAKLRDETATATGHGTRATAPSRATGPGDATDAAPVTAPGTVLGTPGYMAPEQAAGAAGAVDERADVYALGAILRFLVTGAAPDEAPGASAGGERAAPPKRLAAVWTRALEAAPEQRYPSVAALAADVTAYLDGGPVAAYRETPVERLGRLAYRHRTPLVLVAAYLLVRVAILAVTGR
jgi:serine/threonine protein kinase